ncbi:hypothetical protein B0H14DRAFT_3478244 [Mycena olivaceomarginata]|nr:hypothetical protein B0H14DRAFT_3478244 [Mycena olivaceomarginata]
MQPPPPTASTAAVSQDNATADLSFTQALNQTTPEEDTNIFVAAQRGDVATLRALLDSGRARATDRNPQTSHPSTGPQLTPSSPRAACSLTPAPTSTPSAATSSPHPSSGPPAAATSTSSSSSSHTAQIPPSPTRRGTMPSQLIWSE